MSSEICVKVSFVTIIVIKILTGYLSESMVLYDLTINECLPFFLQYVKIFITRGDFNEKSFLFIWYYFFDLQRIRLNDAFFDNGNFIIFHFGFLFGFLHKGLIPRIQEVQA